jgi:hypothetical protein
MQGPFCAFPTETLRAAWCMKAAQWSKASSMFGGGAMDIVLKTDVYFDPQPYMYIIRSDALYKKE